MIHPQLVSPFFALSHCTMIIAHFQWVRVSVNTCSIVFRSTTHPWIPPCWVPSWGVGGCGWLCSTPRRRQNVLGWTALWLPGNLWPGSSPLCCNLCGQGQNRVRVGSYFNFLTHRPSWLVDEKLKKKTLAIHIVYQPRWLQDLKNTTEKQRENGAYCTRTLWSLLPVQI